MLLQTLPPGAVVELGCLIVQRSQFAIVLQDDVDKFIVRGSLGPSLLLDCQFPLAAVVLGGVAGELMANPQPRLHRLHPSGAVVESASDACETSERVGIEKFVNCLDRLGELWIVAARRDDAQRRDGERTAYVRRSQTFG